jgi:hypothetical protein
MRRLLAVLSLSTAIAALAGPLSSTASAFGPCSKPTPIQNLETGYYVAEHSSEGGRVAADQGSLWGWPEYFQTCLTNRGHMALYADGNGLWVGAYGWTGGLMYAADYQVFGVDEYDIPWWGADEEMFSVPYEEAGYGFPIVSAIPFKLDITFGGWPDLFSYGALGNP